MDAATTQPAQQTFWDPLLTMVTLDHIPSRQEFVNLMLDLGALQGLLLLGIGAVYLLCGWKASKALVVANAGVIGALLGTALGGMLDGPSMQVVGGIAGALLFGALAWPLMKYAIGVMGALAGSFVGFTMWNYVALLGGSQAPWQHAWAGALIGLISLGLLAFVLARETTIIFTAVEGAVFVVTGGLTLLLKFDSVHATLPGNLVSNMHLLPVLILVPALIGVAFQQTELAKKNKKKAKPAPA